MALTGGGGDGCGAGEGLRGVLGMHETVCTGAADAYGRMTGRPALTLLHLGVGLANGVANLHNARRAGSPVVNVVGDMASWHVGTDAPLVMDIEGVARTVSSWVRTSSSAAGVAQDVSEAMASATSCPRAGGRVSTLIVPHDFQWEKVSDGTGAHDAHGSSPAAATGAAAPLEPAAEAFIKDCAAKLKAAPRGKAAFFLGGRALVNDEGTLDALGRASAATGAPLFCENAFPRIDRGVGRPKVQRLAYFPQDAVRELSKFDMVVCVDAKPPVAMFGYDGGPTDILKLPEDNIWEIDFEVAAAVALLSKEVGGSGVVPGRNCMGCFHTAPARPAMPAPDSKLSPPALCNMIAHLQPENAIIVDESLTSGGHYFKASENCPPFAHLTLTGGAIGCGPPMAVGAAVACPGRRVINFQADGSGLYSAQALWTQARENLDVVTVVCNNSTYAILKIELTKQGLGSKSGGANAKRLTELGSPKIDWVALGRGYGVPSSQATTVRAFADQMRTALSRAGPSLIEVLL